MAPDFEILQKVEIMRMISFFLPDLRLSAVGTPELRIIMRMISFFLPDLRLSAVGTPELRIAALAAVSISP